MKQLMRSRLSNESAKRLWVVAILGVLLSLPLLPAGTLSHGITAAANSVFDFTSSANVKVRILNTNAFYCDAYATVKDCVDAANAAGGGVAKVVVPGTYTIASTLQIGVNGGANPAKTVLEVWPGVKLSCTMTDGGVCAACADASGILGISRGFNLLSSGSNVPRMEAANGSKITALVGPLTPDGATQTSFFVEGIYFVGNSAHTVFNAFVDTRGAQSSTTIQNNQFANLYDTIGLLVEAPPSLLFSPTTVSGSGTTITLTLPPSATRYPTGHYAMPGAYITLTGCTGGTGTFNGTWPVATINSRTIFTVTAGGTVSGSPTGCTYTFKRSDGSAITRISSVLKITNNTFNGGGLDGARPMVIWGDGATSVGSILLDHDQFEGQADGGFGLEIDSNGGTGSNAIENITIINTHCEPHASDTGAPRCISIKDAHDIQILGLDGSGAGATDTGSLVYIDQSAPGKTYNISVSGLYNLNWGVSITNTIRNESITDGSPGPYFFAGKNGTPPSGDICGDPHVICDWDHFWHNSTLLTGSIGKLGWTTSVIAAGTLTPSYGTDTLPFIGGVILTTNGTAGQGGTMHLGSGNTSSLGKLLGTTYPWSMDIEFSIGQIIDTTIWLGTGGSTNADPPADGAGIRFDTNLTDTTFKFVSESASVATTSDTTVPVVANTVYRLNMTNANGTSGRLNFALYSGTGTRLAGPVSFYPGAIAPDVAATLSTNANQLPILSLITATGGAGGAKTMKIYFWRFMMWNLNR